MKERRYGMAFAIVTLLLPLSITAVYGAVTKEREG